MKKLLLLLLLIGFAMGTGFAQKAKIVTEAVTPNKLHTLGLTTNSVSTGLDIVPRQTYVYLSAKNIGNTETITNAVFTLTQKPGGSTADLTVINPTWVQFLPDINGEYKIQLSITTASGTHDTTKSIYSANFVGVGGYEGIAAQYPNCMSCHGSHSSFTAIFDKWKVSSHATIFKREITTGAAHYSSNCIKCHTTGTDHNIAAANNGFDDIASALGWSFVGPPNAGKWDTLKTQFPTLVNHATIGCESCHGPGSEHSMGGSPLKIQTSLEPGSCGQCHDEPWRHNKYVQYEKSSHSNVLWSNSFAQGSASQNNNLQNCIRCHDGQAFVNFTNGVTTNTTGWTAANLTHVTCAACHDPHGNSFEGSLRQTPAGSDTLGNGFQYTVGGTGMLCMNCHKARRDNEVYMQSAISSHWGPHYSVQADVYLGQNAAEFDSPFLSGNHKFAVGNSCVSCHMVATVDTGNVNRDLVGGHSFSLYNEDTDYYHTTSCTGCHGPTTSWDDFMSLADYDGNGVIESIPAEIEGLTKLLKKWLPPVGIDSISWSDIRDANDLDMKKAYWNYQLIAYDGSKGMHNTKYAIDVLSKSILAIGGVIPVELVAFEASVTGSNVNLSWQTATETNNSGFEVERKIKDSWTKLGFVSGKGTTTQLSQYTYLDDVTGINSSKISYRLKQIDYDGSINYSKEIEVELSQGPKDYTLSQNYPNPFNPSSAISFSLPLESSVRLVVYNITGEEVRELVNEVMPAGVHESSFNLSNLSSGVYFYSLEAVSVDGSKSFKQVRKMVLLK
jgi:archaellin